jgi:hypothetical protein
MSFLGRRIALCVVVLFALAGCSTTDQKPGPQETQQQGCVADQCDGQEPSAFTCDDRPETIAIKDANAGGMRGILELRKANPADCDRSYWGRYIPASNVVDQWELSLVRDDDRKVVQKSEPGNPLTIAYTVMLHAKNDTAMKVCLRNMASDQEDCVSTVPS